MVWEAVTRLCEFAVPTPLQMCELQKAHNNTLHVSVFVLALYSVPM